MGHVQIPTIKRVGIRRFIVMKRLYKNRLTFGIVHQSLSHVLGTRLQLRVKAKIHLSKESLHCRIGLFVDCFVHKFKLDLDCIILFRDKADK